MGVRLSMSFTKERLRWWAVTMLGVLCAGLAEVRANVTNGPEACMAPAAINSLALTPAECPPGYDLLACPDVLSRLGMQSNPGVMTNPCETGAVARWGGRVSVAAIYGQGDEPRLMMNGILFESDASLKEFLDFQQGKTRRVQAFTRTDADGHWLLLWALDRDVAYSAEELARIAAALDRYAARRKLGKVESSSFLIEP
jgi:hypothetical protein